MLFERVELDLAEPGGAASSPFARDGRSDSARVNYQSLSGGDGLYGLCAFDGCPNRKAGRAIELD